MILFRVNKKRFFNFFYVFLFAFPFSAHSSSELVYNEYFTTANSYNTINDYGNFYLYSYVQVFQHVETDSGWMCMLVENKPMYKHDPMVIYADQDDVWSHVILEANRVDLNTCTQDNYTATFTFDRNTPISPTFMGEEQSTSPSSPPVVEEETSPDPDACTVGVCCPNSSTYDPVLCADLSLGTDDLPDIEDPDTCTMGVCCPNSSTFDQNLCDQLTSGEDLDMPPEEEYQPLPDDNISDEPDYEIPESSPETSNDSKDVVNAINSMSDRMANFFSQSLSKTDLANQTGEITTSISNQTSQINANFANQVARLQNSIANSSNAITNQLANQGSKVAGSVKSLETQNKIGFNKVEQAINAQSQTLNNMDSSLSSIDSSIVNVDSSLSSIDESIADSNGLLEDIKSFFTSEDPSITTAQAEFDSPIDTDSLDTDIDSVANSINNKLNENSIEYQIDDFETNTFDLSGGNYSTVLPVNVLGNEYQLDIEPAFMLAQIVSIFLMAGAFLMSYRIVARAVSG